MTKITYSIFLLTFLFFGFAQGQNTSNCYYTLKASDAFNDGWDTGILSIKIDEKSEDYTLKSGDYEEISLEVSQNSVIELKWKRDSDFPEEIKYELLDADGNSVVIIENPMVTDEAFSVIANCAACARPSNVELVASHPDGAQFSWLKVNSANSYKVVITVVGGDPNTDAVAEFYPSATDTKFTVTGLNNETDYLFYIASVCEAENSNFAEALPFTTQASCPAPENLEASLIGGNFVELSWQSSINATQYHIVIVEKDDDITAVVKETDVAAGNASVKLTGLNPEIAYDAYISSYCGASDVSIMYGPLSFTTTCAAISAPYNQPFNVTKTPACWLETGKEGWQYDSEPDYDAIDAHDHTTGDADSNDFVWLDNSVNQLNDVSVLSTPFINITALHKPFVSFWLFSSNDSEPDSFNTLKVDLYTGDDWVELLTLQRKTTGADGWEEFKYDLSEYNITGNVQLRFSNITNSSGILYYNDILIDDVSFDESTCVDPHASLSAITTNSATLSWDDIQNDAAGYSWAIYELGADIDAETPIANGTTAANNNEINLTGLNAGTAYTVYVRSNCSDFYEYAGTNFITKANCNSPQAVAIKALNTSVIALSWNAPGGDNSGYEYVITTKNGNPYLASDVKSKGTTLERYAEVTDLQIDVFYDVYVRAQCDPVTNGNSLFTEPLRFAIFGGCDRIFTDTGGISGKYANNEKYVIFFLPAQAGKRVTLDFTAVDIEASFDLLTIINGSSTTEYVLEDEVASAKAYSSTTADGALTVSFRSDVSLNRPGWRANVDCDENLSSDEFFTEKISVYPNPAQNEIFIKSKATIYNIVLYDISGKVVKNYRESEKLIKHLDISSLQTGMYFLHLESGAGAEIIKVMKL